MFSSDRFHPSAEGYARAASVVLPTLLAVLGEEDRPVPLDGEDMRGLAEAAHEAVREAGTEVSATRVDGRWAVLRRHPWFGHKAPVPSGPAAAGAVGWTPADH
jgi:hypothetical protein